MGWDGRKNQRECKATVRPSPVAADTLHLLDWGLGTGDLGLGLRYGANLYLGEYLRRYSGHHGRCGKIPYGPRLTGLTGRLTAGGNAPEVPESCAAARYRRGTPALNQRVPSLAATRSGWEEKKGPRVPLVPSASHCLH